MKIKTYIRIKCMKVINKNELRFPIYDKKYKTLFTV